MERQRHFLLVHGACHGAWCWYKVSTLLKSAGHKVTALDLAASGVHPKQVHELHSWSDYFEPLIEFMASLPPKEKVIIVGHSMGGYSISAAMERFSERISAAVFAAAFMPGPDLNYGTLQQEFTRRPLADMQFIFDDGPNKPPIAVLFGPNALANLYQLSPIEDLTLAKLLLRPVRLLSKDVIQADLVLTKDKYGSVPRVYIVCGQDNTIEEGLQRWMIENNPTDEVKVIPDSGHMVMFSKPKELCSCLYEIAMKYP